MLNSFWRPLKSGTDIRGVACENEAGEAVNLTDDAVAAITNGFLVWLEGRAGKQAAALRLAIGHDSRISAERIQNAAAGALTRAGAQVFLCGLSSTPAMFMAVRSLDCDATIQITASHHPYHRNGLKFFTPGGGLEGSDIEAILQNAQDGRAPRAAAQPGRTEAVDFMPRYARRLREMVCAGIGVNDAAQRPLKEFHIVVDAGNGAGGFYATEVLAPLGADISGSQFLEPDGRFPNHIPNPENGEAMASASRATLAAGADLGIIFDTDVDRAGAVDRTGKEINRNRLVALASAIALEGNPGGAIVTDSITSTGLKTYIEQELGGVHYRYKRGYKNVIDEAVRLNRAGVNCPLAIETSGHAAFRENDFLDDGAYLVTKLIIKMAVLRREGKALEDLLAGLAEPVETAELRLAIRAEDFRAYGERVIEELERFSRKQSWDIAPDNREGIRVSFPKGHGNGWFLLRLSVHDPIMPLNIESDSVGGAKEIAVQLYAFLRLAEKLDVSPLEAFLAR